MVGVAQRPRLIRVKVRVPSHPRSREVGVCEEAAFPIEGGAVPVEARGEKDHDVRLLPPTVLDLLVGDFVKGQRGHPLPDSERLPYGFV